MPRRCGRKYEAWFNRSMRSSSSGMPIWTCRPQIARRRPTPCRSTRKLCIAAALGGLLRVPAGERVGRCGDRREAVARRDRRDGSRATAADQRAPRRGSRKPGCRPRSASAGIPGSPGRRAAPRIRPASPRGGSPTTSRVARSTRKYSSSMPRVNSGPDSATSGSPHAEDRAGLTERGSRRGQRPLSTWWKKSAQLRLKRSGSSRLSACPVLGRRRAPRSGSCASSGGPVRGTGRPRRRS